MSRIIDITGTRFKRLLVVDFLERSKDKTFWVCVCDCGELCAVEGHHLKCGDTGSCGCLHREITTVHGMSNHSIYRLWYAVMERCYNEKAHMFKHYGGRGITVCKRWHVFNNFFEDMGFKPTGKTLDRVNNSLGYSKNNCRWATHREQMNNTRKNIDTRIVVGSGALTIADFCRKFSANYSTVHSKAARANKIGSPIISVFGNEYKLTKEKSCHSI
jgi:hypothetical protein